MSFWSVVLKLPKDPKAKIVLEYAPATIFFESDDDIKGIAVFSDQDAAQSFRQQIAAMVTMEVICMPLHSVEDVRAWCDLLLKYLGPKKYDTLPIYLDPPDQYCKGVSIPRDLKNIWTFITAKMPEEMHPLGGDIVGFEMCHNCGVVILRNQETGQYGALAHLDAGTIHSGGLEMLNEYMESKGTTSEYTWERTKPCDSIIQAKTDAEKLINKKVWCRE